MPIDPDLLTQALRTPRTRDVTESPIVRAVILTDAANAADLVPALEQADTLESANARRILCLFGVDAIQHLLAALMPAGGRARSEGLDVLWALLAGEPGSVVRRTLEGSQRELYTLLDDQRPLPDDIPDEVERDFDGRVCDLAYLVVQQLMDPIADVSVFRASDDADRDEQIRRLKSRGFGLTIA